MQGLKYKKILLPLDNSEHSDHAMEAALAIAALHASEVTGCHVYAARLHEARFMDMEKGLPPQYRSESVLKRQREVHGDLIEKGLNIVADSYLDRLEEAAGKRGVTTRRRNLEGKNWVELLKEAGKGDYDLVTMGGLGKGKVELSLIGGVSERVARGITKDILVTKTGSFDGKVVACIDGSPSSYGALEVAIALSLIFGGKGGKGGKVGKVGEVEALAVFDPYFHQVAFRNIAGALSDEAARLFKFEEQERKAPRRDNR
jgi:nucleotide-binding universal stress UspA family protein